MKWLLTLVCVFYIPLGMCAQQPLEVFDAPTPQLVDFQSPKTKPTENKFEKRSFRLLESLFVFSAHADLSSTDDFLHHPQHVEYRGVCGGQPCGYVSYGYSPQWFTEVGRPARIMGCGSRNVDCSLLANTANNAMVLVSAELLHRKGKLSKALAWGFLTAQVVTNFKAAWYNKTVTLNEKLYVPSGATDISWYNPH